MSGGLASLRPQTARETCWTAQASVVPPWGPKQNFLAVERKNVFLPWLGGVQRPCGSPSSCLSGLQPAAYRLPLCSQLSWRLRTERGMSQDWSRELDRSGFNVRLVVCYSAPFTILPLTCHRSQDMMGITDRGFLGHYLYVMIGWLIFGQAPLLPCVPSPEMRDNGPMCVCKLSRHGFHRLCETGD